LFRALASPHFLRTAAAAAGGLQDCFGLPCRGGSRPPCNPLTAAAAAQ
jgi:hypothetical protein